MTREPKTADKYSLEVAEEPPVASLEQRVDHSWTEGFDPAVNRERGEQQPTVLPSQELSSQKNIGSSHLFILCSCSSPEVGDDVSLSLRSLPSYWIPFGERWPLLLATGH